VKRLRPRWALLALFALVVAAVGSACSVVDPPALSVDGTELSRSELFEQLPDYVQPATGVATTDEDFDPSQVASFLTERTYIFLIQNELAARGIEPTDQDRAAVAGESVPDGDYGLLLQEALAGREALIRALGDEAGVDDAAVDELAQQLYEQNRSALGTPGSTCLSAILVTAADIDLTTGEVLEEATDADFEQALADAEAAKAKIDAGASFGSVAETDSDFPAEQAPNGEVGCFSDEEVATLGSEALAGVIPDLAVGEVSEPVRDDIGYYLLTVTSRTESEVPTFDEVAEQFRQEARRQLAGDAFDTWLAQQLAEADISVDSRFGTWNDEILAVDPPTGATPAGPTTTSPVLGGDVVPSDEPVAEEVG
jgi:hypothetical protein